MEYSVKKVVDDKMQSQTFALVSHASKQPLLAMALRVIRSYVQVAKVLSEHRDLTECVATRRSRRKVV